VNTEDTDIEISDVYNYSGGGTTMTNFEFFAELVSNWGIEYDDSADVTNPVIDTVIVRYRNPVNTGRTGTIEYNITYGV
jgi:hypothetical protein